MSRIQNVGFILFWSTKGNVHVHSCLLLQSCNLHYFFKKVMYIFSHCLVWCSCTQTFQLQILFFHFVFNVLILMAQFHGFVRSIFNLYVIHKTMEQLATFSKVALMEINTCSLLGTLKKSFRCSPAVLNRSLMMTAFSLCL